MLFINFPVESILGPPPAAHVCPLLVSAHRWASVLKALGLKKVKKWDLVKGGLICCQTDSQVRLSNIRWAISDDLKFIFQGCRWLRGTVIFSTVDSAHCYPTARLLNTTALFRGPTRDHGDPWGPSNMRRSSIPLWFPMQPSGLPEWKGAYEYIYLMSVLHGSVY